MPQTREQADKNKWAEIKRLTREEKYDILIENLWEDNHLEEIENEQAYM